MAESKAQKRGNLKEEAQLAKAYWIASYRSVKDPAALEALRRASRAGDLGSSRT